MNDRTIDRICEMFAAATSVTGITGIGYRAWQEDELNFIYLHEALIEWFGGEHDGAHVIQGFAVSLTAMMDLFDDRPEVDLDATLPNTDDEPYDSPSVGMEGEIEGEPWYVRIFTSPPTDAEAGVMTDGMKFWHKA